MTLPSHNGRPRPLAETWTIQIADSIQRSTAYTVEERRFCVTTSFPVCVPVRTSLARHRINVYTCVRTCVRVHQSRVLILPYVFPPSSPFVHALPFPSTIRSTSTSSCYLLQRIQSFYFFSFSIFLFLALFFPTGEVKVISTITSVQIDWSRRKINYLYVLS